MNHPDAFQGFRSRSWRFFSSVRLTVALLLCLAATSILGTLIPQNDDPGAYLDTFGPVLFRFFSLLSLFDMYHSWWFQLLLILLTANVVVCSLDRFKPTWKIAWMRKPVFHPSQFSAARGGKGFGMPLAPEPLAEAIRSRVSRAFGHCRLERAEGGGFHVWAEKWRWSRLGVYVVHLSVVLLLIGGMIGSRFGFEGFVTVAEGETVDRIRLRGGGEILPLPFAIRCDDFDVSFYDTGSPREFRSSLSLLKGEETILQRDIRVNEPLRHAGINIFQSSYGPLPPRRMTLNFTDRETEVVYPREAEIGQAVTIPEEGGSLTIQGFQSRAEFMGRPVGEAFVGLLTPPRGEPVEVLLPLRFPSFDKMRGDRWIVSIGELEQRYYTGLQVTRDPGVWVVYLGFCLMIAGCFITFFMPHQRLWVRVEPEGEGSRVAVSGASAKNPLAMDRKVDRIAEELARLSGDGRPGLS